MKRAGEPNKLCWKHTNKWSACVEYLISIHVWEDWGIEINVLNSY